jgi:hypothetical protein
VSTVDLEVDLARRGIASFDELDFERSPAVQEDLGPIALASGAEDEVFEARKAVDPEGHVDVSIMIHDLSLSDQSEERPGVDPVGDVMLLQRSGDPGKLLVHGSRVHSGRRGT